MQFSTLTLQALISIENLTKGHVNVPISWEEARKGIQNSGFTMKQAEGELERFCYGFECIDFYDQTNVRRLALTNIGRSFVDRLLEEYDYQRAQVACILRPARKKECWNVIVQETTFFKPAIYDLLAQYKFRPGPARDFLKCISISDLTHFLDSAIEALSQPSGTAPRPTLHDCVRCVEQYGKYWASVGGRYSWFVFGQEYVLPISDREWQLYQSLMQALVRPPEWGGGKELSYDSLCNLLTGERTFLQFRELGIIRPRWTDSNIKNAFFRLTAPGYLFWERKNKGFCYEFRFRRESEDVFSLGLCDATDFPRRPGLEDSFQTNGSGVPSLVWRGNKDNVLTRFKNAIVKEPDLLF